MSTCSAPHPDDPQRTCAEREGVGHADHWDRVDPTSPWPNTALLEQMALRRTHSSTKAKKTRRSALTQVAAAISSSRMGLSRDEGMALAYDAQIQTRVNFERVIYHLARTTPPEEPFSANEVWTYWRDVLGWPDPPKKQFVGPAMKASATQHGWTRVVGETANTSGNGHAEREVNRTYASLIYAPQSS